MSRVHDHDQLVAQLTRALPEVSLGEVTELARKLRRAGTTLQRLAEAQCNGDWPADNGERKVIACSRCESLWVRSSMVRDHTAPKVQHVGEMGAHWIPLICKDCRTQDRVRELLKPYGLVPRFGGDPRGPVLRVFPVGVDWQRVENGSERGVYVS